MSDEPIRLSKLLSQRGLCSRREADEFITRGLVLVDGVPVTQLGTKVLPSQAISLARTAEREQQKLATILLNKPIGYVSGLPEKGYKPAVELLISANRSERTVGPQGDPCRLEGLAPAGRLDIDSKGLLVFTQDGRLARQLTSEDSKLEKEYLVRVEGGLPEEGIAKLRHGLSLDGKVLRPAVVEWINAEQFRFVLTEGRKRQIRRMCDQVGLKVIGLKRVRIGQIKLGRLPEGQWRYLEPGETF